MILNLKKSIKLSLIITLLIMCSCVHHKDNNEHNPSYYSLDAHDLPQKIKSSLDSNNIQYDEFKLDGGVTVIKTELTIGNESSLIHIFISPTLHRYDIVGVSLPPKVLPITYNILQFINQYNINNMGITCSIRDNGNIVFTLSQLTDNKSFSPTIFEENIDKINKEVTSVAPYLYNLNSSNY